MQYIYAPGWNLYCIAVNLTSYSVSLSVNGAIVTKDIYIKVLNSQSAYLLNNTLIVNNEMFSMVNIYDTDLATASAAAINNKPGKYLSWDPDRWRQNMGSINQPSNQNMGSSNQSINQYMGASNTWTQNMGSYGENKKGWVNKYLKISLH